MKHTLILSFLLIVFYNANSQQIAILKPDYDLIKEEIQDSASIFYYPKLISRLESYDTTLNTDDYRYLYYGYIYQNEYKPYWTSPDEKELLSFYRRESLSEEDYEKIISLATQSINEFPFDLRQLNYLGYVYHLKGDEEMARKISHRFQGIVSAILSSGDGEKCKTGFHVISVSHEYVIINLFQFQVKQQSLIGDCDFLEFIKDDRNIEGLYFNIKMLLEKNLENFK